MAEYKVKFEVFEGPMDLLLYLVKKEEVDIYEVNLTKLAREFIEYVDLMREFDIEIAGEFLVMASTLMYIKSKELLPVDQQVQAEDDDEGEDPRWELIRKLVEYKKFKDAAGKLETLEAEQEDVYPRLPAKQEFEMPEDRGPRTEVSLFDLIDAVNDVIKRVESRNASGAATETPRRLSGAESALAGTRAADADLGAAGDAAAAEADIKADAQGSAAYKRELLRVYVGRAVRQALSRKSGRGG